MLAALDSYDRQGLRPAMELLRDLESFATERSGAPFARFAEVEGRLTRFVQGLSGRPLAVRSVARALPHGPTPTRSSCPNCWRSNPRPTATGACTRRWPRTCGRRRAMAPSTSTSMRRSLCCPIGRARWSGWRCWKPCDSMPASPPSYPVSPAEMAELRGPWPDALATVLPRLQAARATVQDSLQPQHRPARPPHPDVDRPPRAVRADHQGVVPAGAGQDRRDGERGDPHRHERAARPGASRPAGRRGARASPRGAIRHKAAVEARAGAGRRHRQGRRVDRQGQTAHRRARLIGDADGEAGAAAAGDRAPQPAVRHDDDGQGHDRRGSSAFASA